MSGLLKVLVYVLIGAAVVTLAWVIVVSLRQHGRSRPVVSASAASIPAIDLRDENVQAAQMPADGWLGLAREQMEKGEWRLALRALYLASLARLAGEGLISLAKHKTNLDYETELRRRAPGRGDVLEWFSARRHAFEWVWYGERPAAEVDVRAWLTELEGRT